MQHVEIAKKLLQWNEKNLVYDADLIKSEIGHYFAELFLVKANGRIYQANHERYFEFLNSFRSTIREIRYEFEEWITDDLSVVIPMKARIVRLDHSVENFEAILILRFNQNGKVVLWHELYFKL